MPVAIHTTLAKRRRRVRSLTLAVLPALLVFAPLLGSWTNGYALAQSLPGAAEWRTPRSAEIIDYGQWLLIGMLGLIALFIVLRGRVRLERRRSHFTVERWSLFDRTLHWYTAGLFIVLALTGLGLLYGPALLIPYLGAERVVLFTTAATNLHNYLGPFFAAGLALELGKWLGRNLPRGADAVWLLRGGGYIGSAHSPAWRMNAGTKLWFWLVFWAGLATAGSGLLLGFPDYGQSLTVLQRAYLVHLAGGFVITAVALGHIYLGLYGTEGALQGMTTGRIDAEWAKQHHDLWYRQMLAGGERAVPPQDGSPLR